MAAFLNRALGLPAGTKVFSDTKAHIFEADVAALAAAGITRGCNPPTNDRFCPDDPVTRGQMAAFLYRALANPENGATGPGVEPMAVTNTDLPTGRVGDAYRATLTASGGTPPYAWSATGLPEGLSLDTSTGEMRGVFGSGTEGTHTVAVTVTDSLGSAGSADLELTVAPFTLASIDAGTYHTCAATPNGVLYCWGRDNDGQLGTGSTSDHRPTPQPVSGGLTFTTFASGGAHTCGVSATNTYCWGQDSDGQLGTGSTSHHMPTPQLVAGDLTLDSLGAGGSHTCGLTDAGDAYCWGAGTSGQLGNAANADRSTPQPVAGGLTFKAVTGGTLHTCGLTHTGDGYCWGHGSMGNLGNNDTTNHSTPQPVSGGHEFTSISAGGHHTCALTATGDAYCWGHASFGRLGAGDTGDYADAPLLVKGGHKFTSISAGGLHTCAVTVDGDAYCWGHGDKGELGTGHIEHDTPQPVAAGGTNSPRSQQAKTTPVLLQSKGRCSAGGATATVKSATEAETTR